MRGCNPRGEAVELAKLLSNAFRPQAVGVSHRPFNDIMPDSIWDYDKKVTDCGGYTPPPRSKSTGFVNDLLNDIDKKENRNREFRPNGNNSLTVVYQISKFCWRSDTAEKIQNRIYSLLADRTRIGRQKIIDEQESRFNYEMIVEIEFKKASLIKQFEEIVRRTGAKVEEVK